MNHGILNSDRCILGWHAGINATANATMAIPIVTNSTRQPHILIIGPCSSEYIGPEPCIHYPYPCCPNCDGLMECYPIDPDN